jgi:hypothetical protein
MAGDDLLDQRRTRTRHAEHEDRHRRLIAAAGFRRDQLAREHRFNAVEQGERRCLVIRDCRALAGIAFDQVLERARIVLEIRVGFPEGEIEVDAVGLRQPFGLGRDRLHGGKMRVAKRKLHRIGEVDVDAGDVRIEADRLEKRLLRLVELAEFLEHVADVVVDVGEIGLQRQRPPIIGERGFEIAAFEGDAAHLVDGVVVVGVERERALGRGGGLFDLVLVEQDAAVVEMEFADPRFDDQRTAQQLRRFVETFEILEREGEIVERVGIVRI